MSNLEFARAQVRDTKIKLHGPEAFAGMAKAGRLVAEALDLLTEHVRPGVTTDELDAMVFDFAMAHDAIPAPLNYRGFPKSICTSLNHVGRHDRRHRRGHPDLCRRRTLQRGARFLRPWLRPRVPRPAEHPPLRRAGRRPAAETGHAVHHRADDQSRQTACENPVGRLDRRDPRPLFIGAVRAHGRRHRDRMRGLHLLTEGLGPAARRALTRANATWASRTSPSRIISAIATLKETLSRRRAGRAARLRAVG